SGSSGHSGGFVVQLRRTSAAGGAPGRGMIHPTSRLSVSTGQPRRCTVGDIAKAREFVAANPRGVLTTYRRDGQAQLSPVPPGGAGGGRIISRATTHAEKP